MEGCDGDQSRRHQKCIEHESRFWGGPKRINFRNVSCSFLCSKVEGSSPFSAMLQEAHSSALAFEKRWYCYTYTIFVKPTNDKSRSRSSSDWILKLGFSRAFCGFRRTGDYLSFSRYGKWGGTCSLNRTFNESHRSPRGGVQAWKGSTQIAPSLQISGQIGIKNFGDDRTFCPDAWTTSSDERTESFVKRDWSNMLESWTGPQNFPEQWRVKNCRVSKCTITTSHDGDFENYCAFCAIDSDTQKTQHLRASKHISMSQNNWFSGTIF